MYEKIISEPTHEDKDGDGKCDRCGTEVKPAHTHSYTETVTPPTCKDKGYTTYTCSCGDSYVDNYTEPNPDNHVDAKNDKVCDLCGADLSPAEPETPEGEGGGSQTGEGTGETGETTPPSDTVEGTTAPSSDPAANNTDTQNLEADPAAAPAASVYTAGIVLLRAGTTDKIVYDTSSRPIYDTSSEPVYDIELKVTGYKYTGWQTLDGATYYFDKNGNKVTGTQVIQGIQYTFSDEGVRSGTIGIDVSKFQSSINWQKVKNAGINFVIIRCGYRGYGSGVLVQDPMFASHITGAKAAGLRVGIYFFSQAVSKAEAVEEASMAVKLARQYGINMPIAIDSEYANGGAGRADGLSKSARTDITIAFCNTVANAGYKPMVYASKSWFSDHLDVSRFPSSYRIWVAHYAKTCGYTGRYDIWQNTSKGSVDGVKGNVDMNISSI